jgi:hypothetical protein
VQSEREDPDVVTVTAAFADVEAAIAALSGGLHTRDVAAQAETYRRVLERWASHPPSSSQRRALFELVAALRDEVRAVAMQHTIPTRPPPPWSRDR